MMTPPPNGNVYDLLPPGIGNPEAWGNVLGWDAFRTLASTVLTGFVPDMYNLLGVPV